MDLRALGRTLSLIALPLGLCVFPLAAVFAAVGYIALAPVRRRPTLLGPAVLVWLALALSAILSGRLAEAAPTVVLLALFGALLLAWQARLAPTDVSPLVAGVALAMLVLGGRALVEVLALGQPRALAGQFHGNVLGALVAIGVPLLAAGIGRTQAVAWRALLALGVVSGTAALILSGSRGALLALVVALSLMAALAVARSGVLRFAVITGSVVLVASVAAIAWLGAGIEHVGRNLLVNASFETGALGWDLGGRSTVALGGAAEGRAAVALVKSLPGSERLLRGRPVPVEEGSVYTVSLRLRIDEPLAPGFLRVEALDADGAMVARAGRDRWTAGVEARAGGPLLLPVGPTDGWLAAEWTLHETPPGTHSLRLALYSTHAAAGPVALVDALQLEAGDRASPFEPGPVPGLTDYLGPLARRLPLLGDGALPLRDRVLMWGLALQLAAERPFLGHGMGAFGELAPRLEPAFPVESYGHSHNLYLELMLAGGSLLLVAVSAWVSLLGVALWRRARVRSGVAAAALGITLGAAAHGGVDVLAWQPYVLGMWWLAVGVGLLDG